MCSYHNKKKKKERKQTLGSSSVSHGPHFLLIDKILAFCLG